MFAVSKTKKILNKFVTAIENTHNTPPIKIELQLMLHFLVASTPLKPTPPLPRLLQLFSPMSIKTR